MPVMVKSLTALILYCVFFSIAILFLSPLYFTERRNVSTYDSDSVNLLSINKASVARELLERQAELEIQDKTDEKSPPRNQLSLPIIQGCPRVPKPLVKYILPDHSVPLTPREKITAMCQQTSPIPIADFFTETMVATLTKIGEGAFADVFGCQKEGWEKLAIKVIPIEGDFKYNDEPQNSFKSIQPETVVSLELSLLGDERNKNDHSVAHYTKNFMQIDRIALCQGMFPEFLMDAWDDYDFRKNSDNDRPDIFSQEQLYLLYSAENSGVQLGSYVYHSFEEAISILQQVSATIAVGEAALEFEHRDMHRGNILVRRTHEETVYFRLNNEDYYIPTHGVIATVVDYTLSRINQGGDCVSYTDLNNMPWLFKGKGDIQFDVYRDMKNTSKAQWEGFNPFTNVLWLNYLATKVSIKAKLKGVSSKTWKKKLHPFVTRIKKNSSAKDVFLNVFSPDSVRRLSVLPKKL